MAHTVTFEHPEYTKHKDAWGLVDDVVAGDTAIKKQQTKYLPKPAPDDTSEINRIRYEQYLFRAIFYNATGRTLQGLVGAAFRKVPMLTIPPVIEYVQDDADGRGVSIYQQSQSAVRATLKRGRHALLVDYPTIERPASRADMASGAIRASIVSVDAVQVLNWRMERVGNRWVLALVVIREFIDVITDDGFGSDVVAQYRVLRMTPEGYTREVWREVGGKPTVVEPQMVVLDGFGRKFEEIPFIFIGSNDNDCSIDPSPLFDMSVVNLGHFRNSADYEDSAYMLGQPQPWISGLTEEWRNWIQEQGIVFGSRSPLLLPQGGAFGLEQVQPNTLAKEAMDQKEAQMVSLGARLIQPGTGVKTATESQGEQEAEHSVLSLVASNVSEAYTRALQWVARFMAAADTGIEYAINQEFVESNLNAQMLTALIQAWQSGRYPDSDLWTQFRKYGLIDAEKDNDSIRDELDSQGPGLGLDEPIS